MKKLLVLQHVDHELLGTLNPLLRRAGFRIRYVNFARYPDAQPGLEGYAGLIILGGPMSVNDARRLPHLTTELKLIDEALRLEVPVLGICLGAQLIAKALGADVYPNLEKEIGWYDISPTEEADGDALLGELHATEKIFQWHGETFDLPKTGRHLAFSSLCANQAFRYGDRVYGFQFHLEVDEPMIQRWLDVADNRREIASVGGADYLERIQRETAEYMARLTELSELVFGGFINLFDVEKRYLELPAR